MLSVLNAPVCELYNRIVAKTVGPWSITGRNLDALDALHFRMLLEPSGCVETFYPIYGHLMR